MCIAQNNSVLCFATKDFSINTTHPGSLLQANADLAFVPYFTPQQPAIVFQFVKKDGGKCQLMDLLSEGPDGI